MNDRSAPKGAPGSTAVDERIVPHPGTVTPLATRCRDEIPEFRDLLDAVGRDRHERIAVCTDDGAGFRTKLTTVGNAHILAGPSAEHDCWFSVQPINARVIKGRGTAKDVIGLCERCTERAGELGDVIARRPL